MILGYKCFNKDLTNRYGQRFEVGKTYHITGNITFGNTGNGFHICSNLEDTLRYFDTFNEEVCICEVKGTGTNIVYNDEYNGYYDMYAVESLTIIRILNREEIINIGLNLNQIRVFRFIQGYKLTKEEINLFKNKFINYSSVLKAIAYYQEGDTNIYNRKKLIKKE